MFWIAITILLLVNILLFTKIYLPDIIEDYIKEEEEKINQMKEELKEIDRILAEDDKRLEEKEYKRKKQKEEEIFKIYFLRNRLFFT